MPVAAPRLTTVYPPTGEYSTVTIGRGAAFLSGEAKIASVKLLPPWKLGVTSVSNSVTTLRLTLPEDLPLGRYHLLMIEADGRKHLRPNAIKVQFSDPEKKLFSLDAFRRMLKTPLKPPPEEPQTP